MASLEAVARIAQSFPEVAEGSSHGSRTWFVQGKAFAWERGFSKADLKRFGDIQPPDGPILAVRVDDVVEKEAILASGVVGIFTIPHFDGYPAVLIQLRKIKTPQLREALTDGWLACAPRKLAESYLKRRR